MFDPAPASDAPHAPSRLALESGPTREALAMTVFNQGAAIVPDILTVAEEQRVLMRIANAPWLSDLSRRVQHYGYRYDYRQRATGRHAPAPAFPRWASVMAERLRPLFDGALPDQCIVNEYRPGQGIGMHADHVSFGPVVISLSLGAAWRMHFRPRSQRPYVRHGLASDEVALLPRRSALVLRGAARSDFMHGIDPATNARQTETRVSATFRTLAR